MSCSCTISACDDCSDVGEETNPTARKIHRCGECYRDILPGEKYERYRGLYDGSWFTAITCIDCKSMRDALFCSYGFEKIWDVVREEYEGGRPPPASCMMKMTKSGRDKVCDIIENGWGDGDE